MQRAKNADRKRRTRALILIGAAVERAGADHLAPEEIEALLAHYIAADAHSDLRNAVAVRMRSQSYEGRIGSIDPLEDGQNESILSPAGAVVS